MTDTKITLKSCPFCGFKPTIKDVEHRRFFDEPKVFYYVQCDCCGIRTELCSDVSIALSKWNRRATDG